MSSPARPFLKWVGGKTTLLPFLLKIYPKKIGTYYEPFLGGGASFWALAQEKRFEKAVLSDLNAELVNAYLMIGGFGEEVIRDLLMVAEAYRIAPKETFTTWRQMDPALLEPVTRAVRMIFLNKTCFNGLYRTNKKGQFNSSWGKDEMAQICDAANISACAQVLREIDSRQDELFVRHNSWQDSISKAQPGDLVYFDPPYVPVSETASFTGYTSEGFDEEAQRALAKSFAELAERGVAVVLSNSDTPLVRELYAGWEIHEVKMGRSINSDGAKREAVGELVVVGRREGLTPFISEHQEDPFTYMNALMEEF